MTQKKIHRFFIQNLPQLWPAEIYDQKLVHQLHKVLRFKPGEEIIVFGNSDAQYHTRILTLSKSSLTLELLREEKVPMPKRKIIAAVAIAKRDSFELIVQKLTELGVSEIIPLLSDRTVKQSVRLDRLQSISDEALEQCGGTVQVIIHKPMTLEVCRANFTLPAVVFAPGAAGEISLTNEMMYFIGPEGGWSDRDLAQLSGAQYASLGERVLRTETAAIVGAAKLLWE
jgi:16S rRNA (uracil1498-N3)-methyltransferase